MALKQTAVSTEARPANPQALPVEGRKRVVIEGITPEVDGGRFPAKRTSGDIVRVEADIFTDGHDSVSAMLLYRHEDTHGWLETPMQALVNDRWAGEFTVPQLGRYRFTIHAWLDHWETWRHDLAKRIEADNDTPLDYLIGADLIEEAAARAVAADADWLRKQAHALRVEQPVEARRRVAMEPSLDAAVSRYPDRRFASEAERELAIVVDPVRAAFGAWYEMFPRSAAPQPGRPGTLADCEARLPYVAGMGFDVVYLPPIHPIGKAFRKGKNNSVNPAPDDTGSPWAIGAAEGGHKSIDPALGTFDDFRRFVARASDLGLDVALDIAFQVSPDHPYVKEHEEWFRKRPDGSIQYAENPPKKYQDIYPFNFETSNWLALWQELKSVFVFWIERGVRIFRVDNPHTKAFAFWEWCITELKRDFPDVLFLSEAFTRPKVMYRLAKLGFSQSYTYFPWRNTKYELTSYLTETTQPPLRDFFRASQWPNTPDILTAFLQTGSRAAFMIRFLLAATLGANYGIYGPAFELLESRPVRPGSEEYLDSEKYQIRHWNLERPDSLRPLITAVNRIRHANAALQNDWSLAFHPVTNDRLLCFSKHSHDGSNLIVTVINLDPSTTQAGMVELPLDRFDIEESGPFAVHDLLTGADYTWRGRRNYVELNPFRTVAHILQLQPRLRAESNLDYFLKP
jgi:starch synthase (maltosyl-transferring)